MRKLLLVIVVIAICIYSYVAVLKDRGQSQSATVDNVQFKQLENKKNYAHLVVNGTRINYDIMQSDKDDYYLTHDEEGRETIYGAIFTEKINKKDFSDNYTVIYGHAMRDGSMFGTLADYQDKNYFDNHKDITITIEGKILRYKIFSAYSFTNEHLMPKYKNKSLEQILEDIKKQSSSYGGNFVEIEKINKIITLSTCEDEIGATRYLVHAVLIE